LAADPASAAATGGAGRGLARTLGDCSRSAADQPPDVPTTFGTLHNSRIAHLLPPFKVAGTFFAKILVSGQELSPEYILLGVIREEPNWQLPRSCGGLAPNQ